MLTKNYKQTIAGGFPDPYGSLNLRLTIAEALTEPMAVHGLYPAKDKEKKRRLC